MIGRWATIRQPRAARGNARHAGSRESVDAGFEGRVNKPKRAKFDRFGLFTSTAGGQMVKIYLDDLTYTAGTVYAIVVA